MIPALLAQIGLPLLVKAVGGALGQVDHPAAKVAAKAMQSVDTAIEDKSITPEQLTEAHRHTERMTELEARVSMTKIREINATIRAEAGSEDAYVRRWRPTFGYAVALTWMATMGAVAWAIVADPVKATPVIAALVNTSPIWGVALGVLGISVAKRSQDKAVAAGQPPAAGLMGGLIKKTLQRRLKN